ncbi:hypothetical protein DAI22_06g248700, partial [Oryza sativa Japonica Group]
LLGENSSSCVVSTKRTILSPFTKEYRVRATNSRILLFLEGVFYKLRKMHKISVLHHQPQVQDHMIISRS